jgi:hypothetical protein
MTTPKIDRDRTCSAVLLRPLVAVGLSLINFSAVGDVRSIYSDRADNKIFSARIEISGPISKADLQKLVKLIPYAIESSLAKKNNSVVARPVVLLNSLGGDLNAAMEMGRILRKHFSWTMVASGAECSSSCILLLAGGATRHAYGDTLRLGIHRHRYDANTFSRLSPTAAKEKYDQQLVMIRDYLGQMGISDALFIEMSQISSGSIKYLSRARADELNLLGDDPAWVEWFRSKEIQRFGDTWVRARDVYIACLNEGRPVSECPAPPPLPKPQ